MAAGAVAFSKYAWAQDNVGGFPTVRVPKGQRKFSSQAVEDLIATVQRGMKNKEMAWLFGNCFPNTLDTTVDFEMLNGRPDTYVITGDIDAMWLRDSSAQVYPYLPLCKKDPQLDLLIQGVINRQAKCIIKDPYANAFYKDENKISEWKSDITDMKPGVHEHKWEVDSLCYPIRLAYGYWKETGKTAPFDEQWKQAMRTIIKTFKAEQRKDGTSPYSFQRVTSWTADAVPMNGKGNPVKGNGLICSTFRPSDDATYFPYLIPSNFFALEAMRQLHELYIKAVPDTELAATAQQLDAEIKQGLIACAITYHHSFGNVLGFETNGYGSYSLMDDANIPSLLSIPYLLPEDSFLPWKEAVQNTRHYVLSNENPFYVKGKAAEGNGSPHTDKDYIWPLSVIMRGLTAQSDEELSKCLAMLQHSHGGKGFMHESFDKDDATKYTRSWFAWANTLFGELIWKTYRDKPGLL